MALIEPAGSGIGLERPELQLARPLALGEVDELGADAAPGVAWIDVELIHAVVLEHEHAGDLAFAVLGHPGLALRDQHIGEMRTYLVVGMGRLGNGRHAGVARPQPHICRSASISSDGAAQADDHATILEAHEVRAAGWPPICAEIHLLAIVGQVSDPTADSTSFPFDEPGREAFSHVRGRTLSYAEWGDFDGITVLGWPGGFGSRFGLGWARLWAARCGVRLIIPDRPGFGRSDPNPGRSVVSTARDVCELVHGLGIDDFSVLGNSSGGPYALATAAVDADAVRRVAVIDGVGVMGAPGAHVGMSADNDDFWSRAPVSPTSTVDVFERGLRKARQSTSLHPERQRDIAEAGRQGPDQLSADAYVITQPWDFDVESIVAPVDLWHGQHDDDVPLVQAQQLADRLGTVTLHVWPGSGHEMPPAAMPDVYACLLSRRERPEL